MSVAAVGGSGGSGDPGRGGSDRYPEKVSFPPEEEEEEEEEFEGKKRGRRGGKKAKKQALLQQAYNLGLHVPKNPAKRVPRVGEIQAGFPITKVIETSSKIEVISGEQRSFRQRLEELGLNSTGVRELVDPSVPRVPEPPGYPPSQLASSSSRPKSPEVGPETVGVVSTFVRTFRPISPKSGPKPVPSKAPGLSVLPSGAIELGEGVVSEPKAVVPVAKPKSLPPPPKSTATASEASVPRPIAPAPDRPEGSSAVGIRGVIREGRISVDFHNCLDVCEAGDASVSGLHPRNIQFLNTILGELADCSYRVGICSYIGNRGAESQARRASLLNGVRDYNIGKAQDRKLGLRIVSRTFEKASCLRSCGFAVHIDDRDDILYQCRQEGLQVYKVGFSRSRNARFDSFPNVREALTYVRDHLPPLKTQNLAFERVFVVP